MRELAQRRAHLQEEAEQIRRNLRALQPHQEAERRELTQALERIEVQLHRLEQPHVVRPPAPREGEELERRLHHLRMAIDNLRAAGLHDQAHALEREGERLVRGERLVAPERGRRPEIVREAPGPAPQLEHAVHELRGQVQELRQQLEEIRQHLKELAGRR